MSDFKQKIIDIIFEPETPVVIAEAPLTDVKKAEKPIEKKEILTTVKIPKAKDIIYKKQEKDSPFININEVPRKEEPEQNQIVEPVYEMRENVSPIFGPIIQKERKKRNASEKDIQRAINNSFSGEYTGIVLSPIYGYDVNKANDARKTLTNVYNVEQSTIDSPYEEAFEIPEDMKETIKEAVEEAVIELTPKSDTSFINKEEVETSNVKEDVYESPVEDYDYQIEQGIEESVLPQIIEEDTIQEEKQVEPEAETSETAQIEIPSFKKSTQKATRSIYDTAPIQLFDFDELNNTNENKDLFDELIGDED